MRGPRWYCPQPAPLQAQREAIDARMEPTPWQALARRRRRGVIMQFHLDGFEPGDTEIADRSERYPASGAQGSVPSEVDVLIVGCGPAGLALAAPFFAVPDIKNFHVE